VPLTESQRVGAVHGRGSTLAAANLALILEGLGRADEARAYRDLAAAVPAGRGH
jgi:hypothetical protein